MRYSSDSISRVGWCSSGVGGDGVVHQDDRQVAGVGVGGGAGDARVGRHPRDHQCADIGDRLGQSRAQEAVVARLHHVDDALEIEALERQ